MIKRRQRGERNESEIVHINDQTVHDEPKIPFGGIKGSGWGRFGVRAGLEKFTELRWISMQRPPAPVSFLAGW
ncbi:MAG: aldehyde dehydrogenase family protein [Acidobacteria bacterium]|nr:aldehyde dehydrogenase family protein [Acidobacteriota bacterium]